MTKGQIEKGYYGIRNRKGIQKRDRSMGKDPLAERTLRQARRWRPFQRR